MKKRNSWILVVLTAVAVGLYWNDEFQSALASFGNLPWWMYFVLAGILFSGYRFLVLTKEEYEQEMEWIEEEGNVYMRRIEAEREKKKAQTKDSRKDEIMFK